MSVRCSPCSLPTVLQVAQWSSNPDHPNLFAFLFLHVDWVPLILRRNIYNRVFWAPCSVPLDSTRVHGWIVQNWASCPPLVHHSSSSSWTTDPGCSLLRLERPPLLWEYGEGTVSWEVFFAFSILFDWKPSMNWWWLKWLWLFLLGQGVWQEPLNQGCSHFQSLWGALASAPQLQGCKSGCLWRTVLGRKLFSNKEHFYLLLRWPWQANEWASVNTWIFPVILFFNVKKYQTVQRTFYKRQTFFFFNPCSPL